MARHPHIYVLLLVAVTATSIWHVLGKLALTHGMDASVFLVYRLLLSGSLLFFAGTYLLGITFVIPRPEHRVRILVLGIVTFTHSVCFVYGLQMTTPFLCAVMQPSVPVLVWLLSVSIGVESANLRKAIGVVLCSLGAVGAAAASAHHSTDGTPKESSDFHTGTLLIVCSCIFYACHLVFQQPLLQSIPPVQVTSMLYLIAGTITFFLTVGRSIAFHLGSSEVTPPYWLLSHDPTAWLALAFCVIFASAFTHGVYSWASKRVAPTTVSVFLTVEPITTTLVSLALTQSGLPSLTEAACAATVAVGVLLVLRGGQTHVDPTGYEMVVKQEEFSIEEDVDVPPKKKRGLSLPTPSHVL